MPSPELIDERFDEIVRELRTLPGAPEPLRKRVFERAAAEPVRPTSGWWSRFSLRTMGWTLATAGAGFVAIALAYGVVTGVQTGGGDDDEGAAAGQTVPQELAPMSRDREVPGGNQLSAPPPAPPSPTESDGEWSSASPPVTTAVSGPAQGEAATLPPGRRLVNYTASMRLRVSDVDELSRTTREAMRIARSLGGFVASVDYATPKGEEGEASLTLRIPTAKVQQAISELSDLGVIVSQQIKITDLQDRVNDDTDQIARVRRTIRRIEARLKQPLSDDERFRLELQLEQSRARLKVLTERREATVRRARLSTITVALTTREAAEQPATPPGRIERAARNAASLLAKEVAALVYFLIAASPLLLLGAAAIFAARMQRRRVDERLLEQA
jgi:hypothetical protein